jgi:predicted LPLAT superfamily acyltransferase
MEKSKKWDGTSKGSTLGTLIFIKIISTLGPLLAYLLLFFVCFYYAIFDKKSRQAIFIFRKRLNKKTNFFNIYWHFFCFGVSLIDRYAFLLGKKNFFIYETINEQFFYNAINRGKGIILLGAHIGNWEIAGNLLGEKFDIPVNFVMLDAERIQMQKVLEKVLINRVINIINLKDSEFESTLRIYNALKRNEIVCMLGDRAIGPQKQKHSFLGKDAYFPIGPFAFAGASSCVIIPIIISKKGIRKYIFKAYTPIHFEGITNENKDKFIFSAIERYVGILEEAVKENPYLWFNFYDFWEEK